MKSLALNGFRFAAVVVAVLFVPISLWAGEAMSFSNQKSHPDPNLKQKLPNGSDAGGMKFGAPGPMDGVAPGMFNSHRRDPRAERKAQNAEDEKANWMVLDRGQLDSEDADNAAFGIKEFDLDKSNGKRNYFFDPPDEKGDRSGRPRLQLGRPPGKSKNPELKESQRESDPGAKGDSNAKGNQPAEKDGKTVGDHVSNDLDLKDLLSPNKANSLAPAEDKTAKLWKEILGTTATTESRADAGRREDGSAADGFRPSTADSAVSARSQGLTPSFGLRNDNSSQPAASSPNPSGSASSGFTAPSVPRTADLYPSSASAPPSVSRVPTPDSSYSSRPNPYGSGSGNSPFGQQQQTQRRPSSSFEIPARPGYGPR